MEEIEQITNHYSKEQQVLQTIEEMAELTKELLKNINRGKNNRKEILDELVDVYVMLEQIQSYYHFTDDEITDGMRKKIERQIKRIQEV